MRYSDDIVVTPSLICFDLCNLEEETKKISESGIQNLHVDIIDGYFSPDMPLGLNSVTSLAKKTSLKMDVHLMVEDNEFFISKLIPSGIDRLCFHFESAKHPDRYVTMLKTAGIKAGIALCPETPIEAIRYLLPSLDYVMLMLINPGYAHFKDEVAVPYAAKKIKETYDYITNNNLSTRIMIDGRTYLETLPTYIKSGADMIVAGSSCLVNDKGTLNENYDKLKELFVKVKDEE